MWLGAITLCLSAIWKVSLYSSKIDHFCLKKQLKDIYKKILKKKKKKKQSHPKIRPLIIK
jgi:predicted phage-related endonuclease